MSVRAKFKVTSVNRQMSSTQEVCTDSANCPKGATYHNQNGVVMTHQIPIELQTIKMSPVYANNNPKHENYTFWKYTPSGTIELGTINPEAYSQFEIDKEYYIDFTKAE